jgi:hypothetical protein
VDGGPVVGKHFDVLGRKTRRRRLPLLGGANGVEQQAVFEKQEDHDDTQIQVREQDEGAGQVVRPRLRGGRPAAQEQQMTDISNWG